MSDKLRRHIEQIVSLTDEEFAFVLSHFKPKKFRRHQIVIHEGDLAPYDFYVVKGLMKVSRVDGDGKEHIIKFGMEDWWISDTEALGLTLENKEKLCAALQKMEHFFRKKTTAGYIALEKRILCFISSSANERYHNLLSIYPGLVQRVPKAMVASYLGVTRETLSRLSADV
jgi:CRP-like cAMP-binding protein